MCGGEDAVGDAGQAICVVELDEGVMADHTEDPVMGEVVPDQLVDLMDRSGRYVLHVDHRVVRQRRTDRRHQRGEVNARVGIHDDQGGPPSAIAGVAIDLQPGIGTDPDPVGARDHDGGLLVVPTGTPSYGH